MPAGDPGSSRAEHRSRYGSRVAIYFREPQVKRVVLVSLASALAMGQQVYETAILEATKRLGNEAGIRVDAWSVRSLRSRFQATAVFPCPH